MQKIIHLLLGKANPERMNGVNRVVFSLATVQQEQNCDVEVWGITYSPRNANYGNRMFKTHLFKASKNKLMMNSDLKDAISLLPANTVFHLHGAFIPEFIQISVFLNQQGIPYVITPHGAYNAPAMRKNRLIKKIYMRLFEARILKRARYVQLLGENEAKDTLALVPGISSRLIPNGEFVNKQNLYVKRCEPVSPVVFGYMGRLNSFHKGLDLLLEGFAIYKHKYSGKGKLYLIGDGADAKILQDTAVHYGINQSVVFWGKKYGEVKNALLDQLDVFYHTSRFEGIPTAVIETSNRGIPCVVSKGTNLLNYVKDFHAGESLDINSPEFIARSMLKMQILKSNKSLPRLSDNTFRMIQQAFDWKVISKQLINLYES